MSLPIRTTLEDIQDVCMYFSTKPTGATIKEAKAVLDSKRLDGRKLTALKFWGLIEEQGDRYKTTAAGREYVKSSSDRVRVLRNVIRDTPPYFAIVERAAHRNEDSLTTTEVAVHWHEHFADSVGKTDKVLKDQAVCFFQLAMGAGLGNLIVGRKGGHTRFSFAVEEVAGFVRIQPEVSKEDGKPVTEKPESPDTEDTAEEEALHESAEQTLRGHELGQGIFIAHGKKKKPMEQLKRILDSFKIPFKVALDEPNLGRPISGKIREVMKSCNCAILIFTADEEFFTKDGDQIWRPSENVVYELGAAGYLYDNRIVIMKEEGVDFPTNFREIGHISFAPDQLDARAMDILKELIGFGIVKVST